MSSYEGHVVGLRHLIWTLNRSEELKKEFRIQQLFIQKMTKKQDYNSSDIPFCFHQYLIEIDRCRYSMSTDFRLELLEAIAREVLIIIERRVGD